MAAAFCLFTASSCGEEDDTYPSAITELADARTDSQGNVVLMTTDDGRTYDVSAQSIRAGQQDTVIRCRCMFLPSETESTRQTAHVYSIERIPSSLPVDRSSLAAGTLAPVKIASHWGGTRYYNFRVEYKTYGNAPHLFLFTEDSIRTSPEGLRTAFISLRHIQKTDTEKAYTSTAFISFPLHLYSNAQHVVLCVDTQEGTRQIKAR